MSRVNEPALNASDALPPAKASLHPRNLHRGPYDFARLSAAHPALAGFLRLDPRAGETIDFADPEAVIALNTALLKACYGLATWSLPPGYLCPPIPSRVDYLHHVADLLADGGPLPRGRDVRLLDLGLGANAIYALLAAQIYGWSVVGSEIDPVAVAHARHLVAANPSVADRIEVRQQPDPAARLRNVVRACETFDLLVCNPPFHASAAEARAAATRKLRNLSGGRRPRAVTLNFGGQAGELWCEGGEVDFIRALTAESAADPGRCRWYTTLVAKSEHLPALERALRAVRPREVRLIALAAGQKQSRILAWTFTGPRPSST